MRATLLLIIIISPFIDKPLLASGRAPQWPVKERKGLTARRSGLGSNVVSILRLETYSIPWFYKQRENPFTRRDRMGLYDAVIHTESAPSSYGTQETGTDIKEHNICDNCTNWVDSLTLCPLCKAVNYYYCDATCKDAHHDLHHSKPSKA